MPCSHVSIELSKIRSPGKNSNVWNWGETKHLQVHVVNLNFMYSVLNVNEFIHDRLGLASPAPPGRAVEVSGVCRIPAYL